MVLATSSARDDREPAEPTRPTRAWAPWAAFAAGLALAAVASLVVGTWRDDPLAPDGRRFVYVGLGPEGVELYRSSDSNLAAGHTRIPSALR